MQLHGNARLTRRQRAELQRLHREEQWSIRIGVPTILLKDELKASVQTAIGSILVALIISSLVAALLAQWMLRPIHVIQSGLTRLGRGELDVTLDLPGEEFRDLGSSFEAVSAQLSAVRSKPLPSAATDLESVMEQHFEIDRLQDVLFVVDSFDQLFDAVERAKRLVG